MSVVENLMLSPIVLRFPTGQLPNPADTTGSPNPAGSVPYSYRIGKHEISEQTTCCGSLCFTAAVSQ
jgi:hypothetical protein